MSKFSPERMYRNKIFMQEYARLQRQFFDELTVYYYEDEKGEIHRTPKLNPSQMPGGRRLAN